MASLYEIAPQHRELAERLRSMGLDDDAVSDTLEAESDLPGKVETYCIVLREKEAETEAFKREKERFEERIKSNESAVKRMKSALLENLKAAGESKVKAGLFNVAVQKSKGSVLIEHPELIPKAYMTDPKPPAPQPDKSLIYAAIADGHKVPGAKVVPGERLAIR